MTSSHGKLDINTRYANVGHKRSGQIQDQDGHETIVRVCTSFLCLLH